MSLFDRFMLWAGFVKTSRVLDGLSGIKEHAWRVSVGLDIFGRRYFEIMEQHAIRDLIERARGPFTDPSLVSSEEAVAAFRRIGIGIIQPTPKIKTKPKKHNGRKKHG